MTTLIIDPTHRSQLTIGIVTPSASMALAYPDGPLHALLDSHTHDAWWPWVTTALSHVNAHPSELSRVIVVAGPGALTPLRLIATAMMGLQLVHHTPIEWVPTDVAFGAGYPNTTLWTVLGGRQNGCMVGLIRNQNGHLERLIDPIAMPLASWQQKATQLAPHSTVVWANHHPHTPTPTTARVALPLDRMQHLTQWVSQGHTFEQVPQLYYGYPAL